MCVFVRVYLPCSLGVNIQLPSQSLITSPVRLPLYLPGSRTTICFQIESLSVLCSLTGNGWKMGQDGQFMTNGLSRVGRVC